MEDIGFDLLELEDYADARRLDLSIAAEQLNLPNLSRACLYSTCPTVIHDEAWQDLVILSRSGLLDAMLPAGAIVYEMKRLINAVGRAALAQEAIDES